SSKRIVEPFPSSDAAILLPSTDAFTNAFEEAHKSIDMLFRDTEPMLVTSINPLDQMKIPTMFWGAHTQSDSTAHQRSFAALVAVAASQKLQREGVALSDFSSRIIADIERFCPLKPTECPSSKFRTIDGTCNNVKRPSWGANYAPMQRLIKPAYSDGISDIRVSVVDESPLPNVRLLSNSLFGESDQKPLKVNMLVTHWAHFVYTDMVHIGSVQLSQGGRHIPLPCCSSEPLHPECLPVIVDADDPRYGGFLNCMPYARTTLAPRQFCALGPREQANQATSYLDASVIYGSTPNRGSVLRTFRDGQLLTSVESINGKMPPTSKIIDSMLTASSACASNGGKICFMSGTEHVNFLPSVTTLHTIWIRQHNRIAASLLAINPKWTDEQLFEESRRIVAAQLQHITYNEFLPIVVGRENWMKYGLQSEPFGFGDSYSLDVDASIINSYAAVVGQVVYPQF
ncbi:unnamed protein product, partial [Toxocara canis]|uniref:Chorion peroxidase n=1 Tax=Toxocara canis TaxID=6265 RepID=A0A183TZS0_TOXCA